MNIHDALQQRRFQNPWHELRANLLYSSGWLRSEIKAFLRPYGITQQQFNVLRILRGSHPDPISTLQLRERMIDKMPDTSRLVDRLQKKGLLSKKPCGEDKRLVDVLITEAGLALLADIDAHLPALDGITQGLTADEAQQLSRLLDKMRMPACDTEAPAHTHSEE